MRVILGMIDDNHNTYETAAVEFDVNDMQRGVGIRFTDDDRRVRVDRREFVALLRLLLMEGGRTSSD